MSKDPGNRPDNRAEIARSTPEQDPPYRVYRSGDSDRGEPAERPYRLYRSAPRGLRERLRGEQEATETPQRRGLGRPSRQARARERRERREDPSGPGPHRRRRLRGRPITPWRIVRWVVGAVLAWVLLAVVLFFVSAETRSGHLPAGARSQLTGGGPMLTSANTVLILGLDNRPRTGAGSKEGGLTASQFTERDANTDSIMLWRIGGGVSRRLSIPRDTLVNVPGLGESKINAAWSYGGPALALKVIKQFTGIRAINHVIIVDLANFPKFINDVGGVNVKTGRICSEISGGRSDGGFTLNLRPGIHHLDGLQALLLARTRENSCDAAYDDLNREAAQQQILNSIKSQLLTAHTFLHLPWVAWDAPGVIQTDMGGLSLMQLFIASEIGGSTPPRLLHEAGTTYNGEDVLMPNEANVRRSVRQLLTGR
jgi:LCP family protein required for cell wall assembly